MCQCTAPEFHVLTFDHQELSLPESVSSVVFLRTKVCVEYPAGYTILDLDTLDTQTLLDTTDPALEFMQEKEDLRPLAMYKSTSEILLCYNREPFLGK
jgi:RHO1 GDP-GTP exchange protein 1/2